jgi:hypothetical protein
MFDFFCRESLISHNEKRGQIYIFILLSVLISEAQKKKTEARDSGLGVREMQKTLGQQRPFNVIAWKQRNR